MRKQYLAQVCRTAPPDGSSHAHTQKSVGGQGPGMYHAPSSTATTTWIQHASPASIVMCVNSASHHAASGIAATSYPCMHWQELSASRLLHSMLACSTDFETSNTGDRHFHASISHLNLQLEWPPLKLLQRPQHTSVMH